ncbi:MAG: sugar transferase [Patescibacteria group bacterium]|nr:sugar transferase [Patescibacteria group bacterium]
MKKTELAFTAVLVPLDLLLVFAAALTAYSLRFGWLASLRPVIFEMPFGNYVLYSTVGSVVFVLAFAFSGLYAASGPRRIRLELSRIFLASSTAIMVGIVLVFFKGELFSSRFIILAVWFFALLYVSGGRIIIRLLQRLLLRFGIGTRKVVVISSDNRAGDALVKAFARFPGLGYKVVRRISHFDPSTKRQLDELVEKNGIDEIIATGADADRDELSRILGFAYSRQLTFKYTADLLATRTVNTEFGEIAGLPFVEIKGTRLDGWGRIFKRIFDIIASLILIVLTSPVMLLTTIMIKLDSKGPVFFARLDDGTSVTRVGEQGKPFRYVKFRSMKPDTHELRYTELAEQDTRKDGPLVKIKDDPRITRVGKFIRRFSIDELPELFMVFIGTMSLVGPRPHLPEEVDRYEDHHRRVLTVKPGITGMSQVSGRANLDFEEEVKLDIYYIENWSPWLDLAILIKTPAVVLARKGAY